MAEQGNSERPDETLRECLKSGSHTASHVRLLAYSFYREMRRNGFTNKDVVALAAQLVKLVTDNPQEW